MYILAMYSCLFILLQMLSEPFYMSVHEVHVPDVLKPNVCHCAKPERIVTNTNKQKTVSTEVHHPQSFLQKHRL